MSDISMICDTNVEWARNLRAMVSDLNEQISEAEGRNVIVALNVRQSYGIANQHIGMPELLITISERI
jgi:hypothetical protein